MDTSKLTFAVFTLDESDHCFAGFHNPDITWNGWNCPFFYQHEVERMRVVWDGIDDVDMEQAVADTKMPADSPFLPIGSHSWTWFEADMGTGREYFLEPITTLAEAESFMQRLHMDDLMFHFDDAPDTIISGATGKALFTDAEAAAIHCRVWEMRSLMKCVFSLPLALTDAEGGQIFRLEWLDPNGASVAADSETDYGSTARLTENHPEVATEDAIKWMSDMTPMESVMLATADERPFQLTRIQ